MPKKIEISQNKLQELYEKQKLTTYQIADKVGCCQATIWKKLIEYQIERRKPHELYSNVPQKEELIKLYVNKKLSTWKIEKDYGYARGTVHRKLKEFKIKTRDRADSHIIYKRKDFSGDLIEKAYLIGFRIGDLGVRKIWPNSKTITIASGSTVKEQITLINNLFKNYGKVWIKIANNNKTNIYVALNESFDFLLSKKVPEWILEKEKCFFAFLGGFTDAEGWIGISKNAAIYSLGNCDLKILLIIKESLGNFGIETNKITTDKRAGKPTTGGYFFKFDYHTLRIGKKGQLLELFNKLKPYIKHGNKIKALNRAIQNIKWRNLKYESK